MANQPDTVRCSDSILNSALWPGPGRRPHARAGRPTSPRRSRSFSPAPKESGVPTNRAMAEASSLREDSVDPSVARVARAVITGILYQG